MQDMTGRPVIRYLKVCWKFVTPTVIFVSLHWILSDIDIDTILNFQILFVRTALTYSPVKYSDDYDYPLWAHMLGLFLALISSVLVPLYFLFRLIKAPGAKVSEVNNFLIS